MGLIGKLIGGISARVLGPPVVRAGLGGAVLGVIAFVMPATLFSGIDALGIVIEDPARLGVGLLLAVVALKLITLSVSMSSGFYGGPFFPAFFMGGTIGAVIYLVVPAFPLQLAVVTSIAITYGLGLVGPWSPTSILDVVEGEIPT